MQIPVPFFFEKRHDICFVALLWLIGLEVGKRFLILSAVKMKPVSAGLKVD